MKKAASPAVINFLLGSLTLFCGLAVGACEDIQENPTAPPARELDFVLSEAFNVEYRFTDSARETARLYARRVIEREEREDETEREGKLVLYLEDSVQILFLGPGGQTTSSVSANQGIYYRDQQLAELKGNVILKNAEGESLETEQLFWDERQEQIYTDQFVRVQRAGKIILADSGLVSNTQFTDYEFRGVSGILDYDEP